MKKEDFDDLVRSMEQTAAWLRGENVPGFRVHFPPGGDVAAIRRRTGLSQAAFARQIGVSVATLRNWEQGRRCPDGPARVLLALLDKDPGDRGADVGAGRLRRRRHAGHRPAVHLASSCRT